MDSWKDWHRLFNNSNSQFHSLTACGARYDTKYFECINSLYLHNKFMKLFHFTVKWSRDLGSCAQMAKLPLKPKSLRFHSLRHLLFTRCWPRMQANNTVPDLQDFRSQSRSFPAHWTLQVNLKKWVQLEESTCLTSGSTTKPQSPREYGTGTKTEI